MAGSVLIHYTGLLLELRTMPKPTPLLSSERLGTRHRQWPTSAYVHLPFCRQRCFYCDFPIAVLRDGHWTHPSAEITTYVDCLCQEIALTPSGSNPLQTVFLGGGTPSLIAPAQLQQILEALEQQFGFASSMELSMEMDPGTFTLAQVQAYQAAGVNRVSLGVQAFADQLLQVCGRGHTVKEIYEAIDLLHQAKVTNFSLDLISGLPSQTLAAWEQTLMTAVEIDPVHLSIYDLTIEPTTLFSQRYQPGRNPLPTDETTAQMYRFASRHLQGAGYQHYEISNYAQPGYQCRHNQVYWHNQPYYGFGMGATSYVWGQRFSRPRKLKDYSQWVQTLPRDQGQIDCPVNTQLEIIQETLMLGLRLAEGVRIEQLQALCGASTVENLLTCLTPFTAQGWIDPQCLRGPDPSIRLTDPEGFLFSNTVLASLWQVLDELMLMELPL